MDEHQSDFQVYSRLPGLVNLKDSQSKFLAFSPQLAKMITMYRVELLNSLMNLLS
jgi:hypothetical protein